MVYNNIMEKYDIVIIGAGLAGLTAGIYAARAGKRVAVVEKNVAGGQILSVEKVENYPAVPNASGWEIADKAREQAEALGAEIIYDEIKSVSLSGDIKRLELVGSGEIECAAVVLAMGAGPKPLGIAREAELSGGGVSYCATCDGAFFKGKDVMVAGAGKTAVEDVEYLSPLANKVYIVGANKLPNFSQPNVERIEKARITSLNGTPLSSVVVAIDNGEREIPVSGLFVAMGSAPDTRILNGAVKLDEKGYIITDETMATSVQGVFAAGDIRHKELRQLVTAASDGAIAAQSAVKFCKK